MNKFLHRILSAIANEKMTMIRPKIYAVEDYTKLSGLLLKSLFAKCAHFSWKKKLPP